ncbi:putative pyridoxal 5'-phosphate synthase subunit PDX2 [Citrus sinensis]|nr:putative pyridoxal 5'-phosphate synthase subunit PDX2 [Citrus sinensis]
MILSKKRKGDVTNVAGHRKREARALKRLGVKGVEIRKPDQLQNVSSLIIPGGESTTMARLAEYHNLLLLKETSGQKLGGQELVGGLDCTVHRNFFGSQIQSFEAELSVPALASQEGGPETFRGVFIRAPAVLDVGPDVDVLADYPVPSNKVLYSSSTVEIQEENAMPEKKVIVAVRQGNLLGTAFHPELTADTRWHSYFLKMMSEVGEGTSSGGKGTSSGIVVVGGENLGFNQQPKIDLPIFQ